MSMTAGTPRWGDWELAYLREHYHVKSAPEIAEALGRTVVAVYGRAAKAGLALPPRPPCTYFREINSPVKAYVLGLLVADGWVAEGNHVGIELAENDREAVALVRDELLPSARLRVYPRHYGQPRVRFQLRDARLAADLARHGVVQRKTGLESWPAELPREFENSFICGYYDGDGHMDWLPRPYWQVACASRSFLEAMSQRIEATIGVKPFGPYRQGPIWAVGKSGEPARAVLTWIHQEVPGLARKRLPEIVTAADEVTRLPPRVAHVAYALMALEDSTQGCGPFSATEIVTYDSEALSAQSTGTALAHARKLRLVDSAPGGPAGALLWWPTSKARELRRALEDRVLTEQEKG